MTTEAAFASGDILPLSDTDETAETARETTQGDYADAPWEVVAVANGLAQAAIIQGRLETEGIPARIHQEPAGVALGLTIGTLGQAEVSVPEPLAEDAMRILEQPQEELEDSEDD
jgi:hypothetical protein